MPNNDSETNARRSALRCLLSSASLAVAAKPLSIALISGMSSTQAFANEELGLLVIMNKDIDMPSINDEELRRLFLGKSRRLPNGARAALAAYAPESSFFNSRVLGRSDAEVSAIWSRLRFSGRTPPPRIYETADAVLAYVRATANALAYIPASAGFNGVRVITNVPRSTPPLVQPR
ncbi:MAG: hypothetical protein KTR35_08255 [Gammaproteobacteria bacterium]|nr:hypothetical protein [Gammaproteobacteria bacterium]